MGYKQTTKQYSTLYKFLMFPTSLKIYLPCFTYVSFFSFKQFLHLSYIFACFFSSFLPSKNYLHVQKKDSQLWILPSATSATTPGVSAGSASPPVEDVEAWISCRFGRQSSERCWITGWKCLVHLGICVCILYIIYIYHILYILYVCMFFLIQTRTLYNLSTVGDFPAHYLSALFFCFSLVVENSFPTVPCGRCRQGGPTRPSICQRSLRFHRQPRRLHQRLQQTST